MTKFILIIAFLFFSVFNLLSQTVVKSILVTDKKIYAGTNYGISVFNEDLNKWRLQTSGLPDNAEMIILHEFNGKIYGVDRAKKLYSIELTDSIWKEVKLPIEISSINSVCSNDTSLFITDLSEGVIYTNDEGIQWKSIAIKEHFLNGKSELHPVKSETNKKKKNQIPDENKNNSKIKFTDFVIAGNSFLAGISSATPSNGVYRSNDHGRNWEEASYDLQRINVKRLIKNDHKMYLISAGLNGEIFYSEDNGFHWEKLNKPNLRWITHFCTENDDIFAAHTRDGIYVSYNNGLNWEKIQNLKLNENQTIESINVFNQKLYIGTTDGLLIMEIEKGIWNLKEETLKTKDSGNFFYAGVGEKSGVKLSAAKYADEIIFKVENTTSKVVQVDIQLEFECEVSGKKLSSQKMEWRITTEPNSVKSYDTDSKSCSVSSCGEKTIHWEITGWKVN